MSPFRSPACAAAAAALVALLAAPRAEACCPAHPPGAHVQIADQEVIVVWDAARKTEHFIRRAAFATAQASFGFLVPTPTVPALAEAPDAVFDRLARAIEPKEEHVPRYRLGSLFLMIGSMSAERAVGAKPAAVRVLHSQRVAGYDAVVLEADDPKALADWLGAHGYESRPALVEWARPYVEARWKITAFKLAAPDDGSLPGAAGGTRYAVRMTFATERPLFPFRTPVDQHGGGPDGAAHGLLRVFFMGPAKAAGALGPDAWGARVAYAERREDAAALLEGAVPPGEAPASAWLTAFDDERWPRAAAGDLTFSDAPDPAPVVPPPIPRPYDVLVPIELLLLIGVVGLAGWRFARRARTG